MHDTNPWVTPTQANPPVQRGVAESLAPAGTTGPVRPQPASVQPPVGGLPVSLVPKQQTRPPYWWVGCHGGAGVSTLAAAIGQSAADAHGHWPAPPQPDLAKVVLVARTHFHGLSMAQLAARQWASGVLPEGIEVLGLVFVADAPGKLPRPLREFAQLVSGGLPRTWEIPWIEELRCGAVPTPDHPAFRQLGVDLYRTISGGTRNA